MSWTFKLLTALLVLIPIGFAGGAAHAEKRIALVIGNADYQTGALNTPANDAGLIAQTLQASGFDVVGARDLDQDSLRRAFRDFLDKASASGTDTVAFIYLSGFGLQLEGENYFVPIDAKIARDTDVPLEAVRVSDYTRPLAALGLKASIVVLDAARGNPFAKSGKPLAGGLALVEPEPGTLVAFNAAPGTVAPEGQGPYGPYAQALAEMMREAGLPIADVFERTRLRVNDVTKGAEVPWHASRVQTQFVFFERGPDAPPPAVSAEQTASMRSRPIGDLDAQQAYLEALDRDTLQGYLDFLTAYPDDPMAARVRAIVAARREAITWRRTRVVDTPDAYWSYLRRYPRGPHAADAERRLAYLAAALEPPPSFPMIDYDVPPPPPDESVYIDRPVLAFDDPDFAFAPPPPAPAYFLPPPSPDFILLPPPPPPIDFFELPIPIYVPVPIWCEPPAYVVPPPNNVIFVNVHNRVEINNTTNIVRITNRAGQTTTLRGEPSGPRGAGRRVGAAPNAPVIGPALPPSVAHKASTMPNRPPPGSNIGASPPQPGQPPRQFGRPLPGAGGQPLPPTGGPPRMGGPAANQPSLMQPGQPRHRFGKPLPGTEGQPLPPVGGAPGAAGPSTGQPGLTQPGRPQRHFGRPLPGAGGQPLPPAAGTPNAGGPPGTQPSLTQPGQPPRHFGRPLPGAGGQPLPPAAGTPNAGGPPGTQPSPTQPGQPPRHFGRPLPGAVGQPPPPAGGVPKMGGPGIAQPQPQPQMRRPPPPPPVVSRPTGPAPFATRPAPPPPAMMRPPPPAVARPAPPPPAAMRPPPPVMRPPPAVMRPPPAVARPAPPPPAVRPPPPPPRAAAPAARNCGGRPCPR